MPRFFLIEHLDDQYDAVGFYTIRDEEQAYSETERFISRFLDPQSPFFDPGYEDACENILLWIDEIGRRGGLEGITSRAENAAEALPPKSNFLKPEGMQNPPLRLYYVRLSPKVLVFCGGGKKTSDTAQGSKGLMSHFRLANRVARELAEMIRRGDIYIEDARLKGELVICVPG